MTLHLAKGRAPLTYKWPLPQATVGLSWSSEIKVWDADGDPADLTFYSLAATVYEPRTQWIVSKGIVTIPALGTIRWLFDDAALSQACTDVYRFVLDAAQINGPTQRLMDCRLPVEQSFVVSGRVVPSPAPPIAKVPGVISSPTAPDLVMAGLVWFESDTSRLYISYLSEETGVLSWVQVQAIPPGPVDVTP